MRAERGRAGNRSQGPGQAARRHCRPGPGRAGRGAQHLRRPGQLAGGDPRRLPESEPGRQQPDDGKPGRDGEGAKQGHCCRGQATVAMQRLVPFARCGVPALGSLLSERHWLMRHSERQAGRHRVDISQAIGVSHLGARGEPWSSM